MLELAKVTDLTNSEMKEFQETAYDLADATGRTVDQSILAVSEFRKMGFSLSEATDLAKDALIFQNIADGIDSSSESASVIISTLKGFNLEASESTKIIDSLNEISNKYSVSTSQLAEGVKRSAGVLAQNNTNLDETIGLLEGGISVLRNAEKVSSGLITISQRLRGISEDGEDLTPKLQGLFDKVSISITDANGELRSTFDILQDLSKVDFSEFEQGSLLQAQIFEAVSGKRQAPVLSAIISQFEEIENVVVDSANSLNSAEEEQSRYLESIEGKLNDLTNSAQEFWATFLSTEFVKGTIDFLTIFVDALTEVNKAFGSMPTLIFAVSQALLVFKGEATIIGLASIAEGIGAVGTASVIAEASVLGLSVALGGLALGVVIIADIINDLEEAEKRVEGLGQASFSELTAKLNELEEAQKKATTTGQWSVLEKQIQEVKNAMNELKMVGSDTADQIYDDLLREKGAREEVAESAGYQINKQKALEAMQAKEDERIQFLIDNYDLLSDRKKAEADNHINNEIDKTNATIEAVKKRIKAYQAELSAIIATATGEDALRAEKQFLKLIPHLEESIDDLTFKRNELLQTKEKMHSADKKEKKAKEDLTKAQRELLAINHQLALTQEDLSQASDDSTSKIPILNALIDLQKDKFHALANSIAEVEEQYKKGDISLDEYNEQMRDFELQQEKTTTAIKGFIREAEGLILDEQKESLKEYNDQLEELTDTLDTALSEAMDKLQDKRDNALDSIQSEIDALKDEKEAIKDENDERERAIRLRDLEQNQREALERLTSRQKELDVKMVVGDKIVNVADPRAVAQAQEDLADATKALEDERRQQREDARIRELEAEISKLEKEKDETKKSYDTRISDLKKFQDEYKTQIEKDGKIQESLMETITNALRSINASYFEDTIAGYKDMVSEINGVLGNIQDVQGLIESGDTGAPSGSRKTSNGGVVPSSTTGTVKKGSTYTYTNPATGKKTTYRVKHDGLRSGDVMGNNLLGSREVAGILENNESVLTGSQTNGLFNIIDAIKNLPTMLPQSQTAGGVTIQGDIIMPDTVTDAPSFARELQNLTRVMNNKSI